MKTALLFFMAFMAYFPVPVLSASDIRVVLELEKKEAYVTGEIYMMICASGFTGYSSTPILRGLRIGGVEDFKVKRTMDSRAINHTGGGFEDLEYVYRIQPAKPGIFTIGPARIKIGGKVYTSNTQTLTVLKKRVETGKDQGRRVSR
jgi:hypothetical protein